jgi:hypothetical protein
VQYSLQSCADFPKSKLDAVASAISLVRNVLASGWVKYLISGIVFTELLPYVCDLVDTNEHRFYGP